MPCGQPVGLRGPSWAIVGHCRPLSAFVGVEAFVSDTITVRVDIVQGELGGWAVGEEQSAMLK